MSRLATTVDWDTTVDFTGTYLFFEEGHAAKEDVIRLYLRRCDGSEGTVSIYDLIKLSGFCFVTCGVTPTLECDFASYFTSRLRWRWRWLN